MTVTPLGRDQDCSLKNREPDVPALWFLDPGGWSKTTSVGLYFIFPGICTLSLEQQTVFLLVAGTVSRKYSTVFLVVILIVIAIIIVVIIFVTTLSRHHYLPSLLDPLSTFSLSIWSSIIKASLASEQCILSDDDDNDDNLDLKSMQTMHVLIWNESPIAMFITVSPTSRAAASTQ
ncbi:hypothetical protein STEG23_015240 [Scotinomys teguina]